MNDNGNSPTSGKGRATDGPNAASSEVTPVATPRVPSPFGSSPRALRSPGGRAASGPSPTTPGRPAVEPGDVIGEKYRIDALIGQGGVGDVFQAQHLELDERVAIKFLKTESMSDKSVVARFVREAKAAVSIKSEYVASVFDVGVLQTGAPYMVMEYLEGKDLGDILAERSVLSVKEAVEYAMQTCEALAVAHSKGIIHRDIKPENLFVTSRGHGNIIKVLDFGISKAALTGSIFGGQLPTVKTQSLMGTPLYMAPEQVRSTHAIDQRSDIWSLGMVLYELLTGSPAFQASSITELCAAILESEVAPLAMHRPEVPAGLAQVVHRCLEKDPKRRFQNVAELAIALMPFGPKRARISAERSSSVMHAAGMVPERYALPSSYPPPGSATADLGASPGALHAPALPAPVTRPEPEGQANARPVVQSGTDSPNPAAGGTLSSGRRLGAIIAAVVVFALIAGFAGWKLRGAGDGQPAASAAPSQAATPTNSASVAPVAPAPAPLPAADSVATDAIDMSAKAPPPDRAPPVHTAAPRPQPAPAAPARSAAPGKPPTPKKSGKSSEEPDMGY
jgi:serine/threonine-protein kinase